MTNKAEEGVCKIGEHKCLCLHETDSTNNYMDRLLEKEELENGFVVLTDFQQAGKGMLQNTWISNRGENLLFSLYIKHRDLSVEKQFFLSKCVSLALHDFISETCTSHDVSIKWPNDVLLNGKKIAGILIKSTLKNTTVSQSIIGIGINVNQGLFPKNIVATSLKSELGKSFDLNDLLTTLLQYLDGRLKILDEKHYSAINLDYHKGLFSFKQWVNYEKDSELFEGRIFEVGDDGRVIIEKRDGSFEKFEVKEISLSRA